MWNTNDGGKSVIGKILPDPQMPITQSGIRADIILNPYGVFKRTNLGQLFELELNFIGQVIRDRIKNLIEKQKYKKAFILYKDIMKIINKEQLKFVLSSVKELSEKKQFLKSIVRDGFYIHQPPFFNNVDIDTFKELYTKFPDIKPYKMKNMNDAIIAPTYILRLKHDAASKFSARSTGMLNLKNIPTKTKTSKQDLYSKTPIRLGEMENLNLLALNKPETLKKFMNIYSLNTENRIETIKQILKEPNIFHIENINHLKSGNNIKQIIEEMFESIGIKINYEEEK